MNEKLMHEILKRCWSKQTSTKWNPEAPALGQCAVTALVVNDHFGDRILKTQTGNRWHFCNEIHGKRVDLTAGQFPELLSYSDIPTTRAEAFEDATLGQYRSLARHFGEELESE